MNLHWPQITIIVLASLEVGLALGMHGKPRSPFSVWWKSLDVGILLWLLHSGGFFGATA